MERKRVTKSPKSETNHFLESSIHLTKILSKDEKKKGGIFFTPQTITKSFTEHILSFISDTNQPFDILEPSCGSGEFIQAILHSKINIKQITGVEWNKKIFEYMNRLEIPQTNFIHKDFVETKIQSDLIIGNPPYFVMKKEKVPIDYLKYIEGRPNIFVLFILHALEMLNSNGILGFIIPSSFLNSKYYEKSRKYIYENFTILDIVNYDEKNDFLETEQNTIGLIVQKKKDIDQQNKKFTLHLNQQIMFFDIDTKLKLENLLVGSTNLKTLGLHVKTGPVVWNENKEKMVDKSNSNDKILVYNSNIVNSKFEIKEFKTKDKKQYIRLDKDDKYVKGPMIVVNRGNGNAKYNFHYCYLDEKIEGREYVVENHLNMIVGDVVKLRMILDSFQNQKTKTFLDLFCRNNGLSKTEIENILPIYTSTQN
jgi:type I restriction-modification system DNA methylase subunit